MPKTDIIVFRAKPTFIQCSGSSSVEAGSADTASITGEKSSMWQELIAPTLATPELRLAYN